MGRMSGSRQLRLGAFMRPTTIHTGAWRYPGAFPDANFNVSHIKRFAQTLERAKFDAFFMADHLAVLNMPLDALKHSHTVTSFEPFTLLSALAMVTEHLGLVATGSTTFDAPYHVARRFASLDHLSGGRCVKGSISCTMRSSASTPATASSTARPARSSAPSISRASWRSARIGAIQRVASCLRSAASRRSRATPIAARPASRRRTACASARLWCPTNPSVCIISTAPPWKRSPSLSRIPGQDAARKSRPAAARKPLLRNAEGRGVILTAARSISAAAERGYASARNAAALAITQAFA